MSEDRRNTTASSEGQQASEGGQVDARLTTLESSLAAIQSSLQLVLQRTSSVAGSSTESGNPPVTSQSQGGQGHLSAAAPSFVQVAASAPLASTSQSLPALSAGGTSLPAAATPFQLLANLQKEAWALNPEQFLSHASTPAMSVSANIPPVPGYIANMVKKGQFVDFVFLRPCNLDKLPGVEPTGAQFSRLIKSELQPIRSFLDWSEAWAIYTGIVAQQAPEKLGSLISYFLLLAKTHRDVQGGGWLDYDRAFRKQAAEKRDLSWSCLEPTLFLSTVVTQGAAAANKSAQPSKFEPKKDAPVCFAWNLSSCTFPRCKYRHVCLKCQGPHRKKDCTEVGPIAASSTTSASSRHRSRSPSPVAAKKSRSK